MEYSTATKMEKTSLSSTISMSLTNVTQRIYTRVWRLYNSIDVKVKNRKNESLLYQDGHHSWAEQDGSDQKRTQRDSGVGTDFVLYTRYVYFVKIHCATLHLFTFSYVCCYLSTHAYSSPSKMTIQALQGRWGPATDYF